MNIRPPRFAFFAFLLAALPTASARAGLFLHSFTCDVAGTPYQVFLSGSGPSNARVLIDGKAIVDAATVSTPEDFSLSLTFDETHHANLRRRSDGISSFTQDGRSILVTCKGQK
jgi:hypothetical protein